MDASQISGDMKLVTPSNDAPVTGVGFIFAGGDCAVVTKSGQTIVVPQAFAGVLFPQAIQKVLQTGTTATSVIVFLG